MFATGLVPLELASKEASAREPALPVLGLTKEDATETVPPNTQPPMLVSTLALLEHP